MPRSNGAGKRWQQRQQPKNKPTLARTRPNPPRVPFLRAPGPSPGPARARRSRLQRRSLFSGLVARLWAGNGEPKLTEFESHSPQRILFPDSSILLGA
ncbi:unnamed protein product [Rangifer tarandus platyrhynchus]|uniref:Uncharacterized protein n=1 Tax=Rangifer tarandus platyrhynchus TaxID=3082113 RepID=A0ABN8ZAT0_RANTA|nr:unnamed protein product [Rangifer tarandus platyrhynchus]